MVRAPCCDKVGLKKGPWSQDEDSILTSYIQEHGHGNWRALPKQAGLLRCGKSCRLRWTNYLRPDIKRGNFSKEEEDTILRLHQQLGNRWSTIAGKLPGRTDNEIKNVWHTHLKKRLHNYKPARISKRQSSTERSNSEVKTLIQPEQEESECKSDSTKVKCPENLPVSPQCSSSELSSVTDVIGNSLSSAIVKEEQVDISSEDFLGIDGDECFWPEALSSENSSLELDFQGELQIGFPLSSGNISSPNVQHVDDAKYFSSIVGDGCMDFWYDVFMKAEELPELPDF